MKRIERYNKTDLNFINDNVFDFNEPRLEKLKQSIKEKTLIIFWGAGLSRIAGCKSWQGLANEVINGLTPSILNYSESDELKKLCVTDVRKVLTICRKLAEVNSMLEDFNELIIKAVEPKDYPLFKELHELLLELKAYAYITTNIDKGMEFARPKFESTQNIYDLTNELPSKISSLINNGNIFYLHGSIDNISTSIFNNENYFSFYDKHEIKELLKDIFSGRFTVLFIGYGLGDYEILTNIFLAAKENNYTKTISHYSLMPMFSNELNRVSIEERYLEVFSICPLFYYIDYSNYESILTILHKFRDVVNEIKSPRMEDLNLIDSV